MDETAPSVRVVPLGSKADTLAHLRPRVGVSAILPQYVFRVSAWRERQQDVVKEIWQHFAPHPVVVRSSAIGEDVADQSLAGRFVSVLRVALEGETALQSAIQQVIRSYDTVEGDHQVLVQPMLQQVAISGVVFTRDLDTLAPYHLFNYDDQSQRTDTVTSGRGGTFKTLVHSRFARTPIRHPQLRAVHRAIRELEALLECDQLDVEFAVTHDGTVYILQVRRLAVHGGPPGCPDELLERHLSHIQGKLTQFIGPHPYLYGSRSVFGVMPDWNPAEIIGIRPRRLALSLYKELVTDNIWAYQRDNYGYRNLRSFPLMISLAGLPYIDVRVSFNSFVPGDLQEDIAERLVNWYIDRLVATPASHDKVEFDIVFSCYTFDLDERLEALAGTFSYWDLGDLRSALRRLTNRIIDPVHGLYKQDFQKLATLRERRSCILESRLDAIGKLYWLLEDCKRYGTLPFAGLARAGFIAVQLLRSMVASSILTQAGMDAYLGSMNTVAKRLSRAMTRVRNGEESLEEFLREYGHLRPGTYDIFSKRYDEDPARYIGTAPAGSVLQEEPFEFTSEQRRRMERSLRQHGISVGVDGLLQFIREAIEGREYSKFVFSRNLSDAIQLISRLGHELGFGDDDLSYVDVTVLLKLYSSVALPDLKTILAREIADGRAQYEVTKRLKLPALICNPDDIYSFELEEGTPNFITLGRITARTVCGTDIRTETIRGRIVMIESADPGYDWIFANGIAGLITMYGGANSHMAIRAAELGIPAVIGCGEKLYRLWAGAHQLEIDAANKQVRVLS